MLHLRALVSRPAAVTNRQRRPALREIATSTRASDEQPASLARPLSRSLRCLALAFDSVAFGRVASAQVAGGPLPPPAGGGGPGGGGGGDGARDREAVEPRRGLAPGRHDHVAQAERGARRDLHARDRHRRGAHGEAVDGDPVAEVRDARRAERRVRAGELHVDGGTARAAARADRHEARHRGRGRRHQQRPAARALAAGLHAHGAEADRRAGPDGHVRHRRRRRARGEVVDGHTGAEVATLPAPKCVSAPEIVTSRVDRRRRPAARPTRPRARPAPRPPAARRSRARSRRPWSRSRRGSRGRRPPRPSTAR